MFVFLAYLVELGGEKSCWFYEKNAVGIICHTDKETSNALEWDIPVSIQMQ